MSRTLRSVAVLVLVVVFLAGPVTAASLPGQAGTSSIWGSVWAWVMELLLPEDGPSGSNGDAGGGGQLPPPGTDDDAGGGIDPDGLKVFVPTPGLRAEDGPAVR